MSDIVIKAENIGKLYKLGEIGTGTLSHDLNRWWARVRGKEDPFAKVAQTNDRTQRGDSDYVWALKDINFEVRQGEVLGIIGRNGAGKSTLLKILSKVTTPTTGQIKVKGRIASLLEVGTGFHPELTGRENIFLNGAILGMSRSEVRAKFDEIVDFAGVERYIDTPVKRYSSGMYVRLAFAVAAFLEPEILIVDEVLAVGDAEFQKKCLGRMKDVSDISGRTVLFVSHNMGAINMLCGRSLLLRNGSLFMQADSKIVIQEYLKGQYGSIPTYFGPAISSKKIWIRKIEIADQSGNSKSEFFHDQDIYIQFEIGFNINAKEHDYKLFVVILASDKTRITSAESPIITDSAIKLQVTKNFLVRGSYSLLAFIHKAQTEQLDIVEDVCNFQIFDSGSNYNIHGKYDYGNVFSCFVWS